MAGTPIVTICRRPLAVLGHRNPVAPGGRLIDPRRVAVLISDKTTGQFVDNTPKIARYDPPGADGRIGIVFTNNPKLFPHGPGRVLVIHDPMRVPLPPGSAVEIRGTVWPRATEVWTFTTPTASWLRIFYPRAGGETYRTYPAPEVRIIRSASRTPAAANVLSYWRDVLSRRREDDPLLRAYRKLEFIHPESALGRYLVGAPIESRQLTAAPIFPFRCNLSQREAVENGLTRSVSVIEGPPGTGKTETILNLVANIIAAGAGSVGVVSFSNAAVDNVREKLDELGFAHVVANLGRKEKREEFFAGQVPRNHLVDALVGNAPDTPPAPERVAEVDHRLRRLQAGGAFSCRTQGRVGRIPVGAAALRAAPAAARGTRTGAPSVAPPFVRPHPRLPGGDPSGARRRIAPGYSGGSGGTSGTDPYAGSTPATPM